MRGLLTFAGAVALAACTLVEQPATATGAGAVSGASVCAPLDYGPPGDYRHFASDAEASAYIEHLQSVRPIATRFVGITTDPHLQDLVAETFRGFQRAFPAATAGMTTVPRVAIVENRSINAFVLPGGLIDEPGYEKAPWLFFVHQSLLDLHRPDDELIGVFAHEMGHLIVRNYVREIRDRIYAAYVVNGDSEDAILGSEQPNDPVIAARTYEIRKMVLRVGRTPALGFNASAWYGNFLLASCPTAAAAANILAEAQRPYTPTDDGPFVATAAPAAELERLTQNVVSNLASCAATSTDHRTFEEWYRDSGIANPQEWMIPEEQEPSGAPLPARVLALEATLRARVVSMRLERYRTYDTEIDSDDAAARVLHALGRDVTANGRFALQSIAPGARAACEEAVASGALIEYGGFDGSHPAPCWRYYHSRQLERAFAQCGGASSTTRRPSGGAALPALTPGAQLDLMRGTQ